VKPKDGTPIRSVHGFDPAAVRLDDAFTHVEPEADPAIRRVRAGPIEAFKYPRLVAGRNPRTAVRNGHGDVIAAQVRRDLDGAGLRSMTQGVFQKVHQRLLNQDLIERHEREVLRDSSGHRAVD
jgi:hypothetical protein